MFETSLSVIAKPVRKLAIPMQYYVTSFRSATISIVCNSYNL